MKIVDFKTFIVGNPWKNWVFIKLYTDEGITGLGEATGGLSTRPHQADIEELARFVIGEDPRHPDKLWHKMYKGRFLKTSLGMTGIELACWDILGKSLGVPVWQLLGGKHRDHLRVYANGWYQGPRKPAFFAERAAKMVEQGYTALKFDPFGGAYRQIDRAENQRMRQFEAERSEQSERLSINIVRAVREAVGPDVDILVEGHNRFSVSHAIRIGKQLEDFDPMCSLRSVVYFVNYLRDARKLCGHQRQRRGSQSNQSASSTRRRLRAHRAVCRLTICTRD